MTPLMEIKPPSRIATLAQAYVGTKLCLHRKGKDSPNSLFRGNRFKVYGDDCMKRTLMLTRQIADSGQTTPLNGDVGDGDASDVKVENYRKLH